MRRQWTLQELRKARDLVESGKSWREAGKILGANPHTLRHQLRKQGFSPDMSKRPRKPMKHESLLQQAISLRNAKHKSWGVIAVEINWPIGEPRSKNQRQSLQIYCRRFAKRCRLTLWSGNPEERFTKWSP